MSTFLESVITKYLGPPTRIVGHGEAYWPCPQCDHPRFHSMPDRPEYKHRYKCWSCGFQGDVLDFLQASHPLEPYDKRLDRLTQLQREFDQEVVVPIYNPGGEEVHGVELLKDLLKAKRIEPDDLLELVADWRHQREMLLEQFSLGRKRRG